MLQIEPGQTLFLWQPDRDKLQRILDRLKRRYRHLGLEERRLMIIAEIQRMNLTETQRRELLRRLRIKKPVYSKGLSCH